MRGEAEGGLQEEEERRGGVLQEMGEEEGVRGEAEGGLQEEEERRGDGARGGRGGGKEKGRMKEEAEEPHLVELLGRVACGLLEDSEEGLLLSQDLPPLDGNLTSLPLAGRRHPGLVEHR